VHGEPDAIDLAYFAVDNLVFGMLLAAEAMTGMFREALRLTPRAAGIGGWKCLLHQRQHANQQFCVH
jgi:hypothetical protein